MSFQKNQDHLGFILVKEFPDQLRLQSPAVQINLLPVSDVNAPIPDVLTNPLKLSNVNAPILDGSEYFFTVHTNLSKIHVLAMPI